MIIDGVNFNEEAVRAMGEDEFVSSHIGLFWQDRDEKTRRKMLAGAYGRMTSRDTDAAESDEKQGK